MKPECDLMKLECEGLVKKDNFKRIWTNFVNEFVYTLHQFMGGVHEVTRLKFCGWLGSYAFHSGDKIWNSAWTDDAQIQ